MLARLGPSQVGGLNGQAHLKLKKNVFFKKKILIKYNFFRKIYWNV